MLGRAWKLYGEGLLTFYAWERQQRGAWHPHALIGGPELKAALRGRAVLFTDVQALWTKAGGGSSWVQGYKSSDAAMYATKMQRASDSTAAHYACKDAYGLTWGLLGSAGNQMIPVPVRPPDRRKA